MPEVLPFVCGVRRLAMGLFVVDLSTEFAEEKQIAKAKLRLLLSSLFRPDNAVGIMLLNSQSIRLQFYSIAS